MYKWGSKKSPNIQKKKIESCLHSETDNKWMPEKIAFKQSQEDIVYPSLSFFYASQLEVDV